MLGMKESEHIDDFHMKLNGIVMNIRALDEELVESYVVKKFLRAMPDKFLQITSTLEQFRNLETMIVEEVVGSLKAHEERVKGKSEAVENQLLLTEEEWAKREGEEKKLLLTREEWIKKISGERSSGFKGRGNSDKSRVKCFNCFGYGQFAADCKKPKRKKEQRQEANMSMIDDDEPALSLAKHDKEKPGLVLDENKVTCSLLAKGDEKNSESNFWYLDNGASNHMTGGKTKFVELDEHITGQVRFGDGSTMEIKGKGTIMLMCKNGELKALHDVYNIPHLRNNIISLGQMSENGNKVIMRGEFLWIYEERGRLLMKVKRSPNRLYKIIIEVSKQRCLMTKPEENSRLWHLRLGHVNYQAMALMSKNNMVNGMPVTVKPNEVCDGCLMGKETRKQIPIKSNYNSNRVLELVHGDLCGPISPENASGGR